jgi:hypothetical protein
MISSRRKYGRLAITLGTGKPSMLRDQALSVSVVTPMNLAVPEMVMS